jgi:catechol 2,3-dioxygenase-like lactoylglutathione lyase family enzyme
MYLTHINITMPAACERIARDFYGGILGLREIARPEPSRAAGEIWFEVGGLELHLSVEEKRNGSDVQRHFGLGCGDVDGLRARARAAGVTIEDGLPGACGHFFVHDPFGNRIEIHAPQCLHDRS